VRAGKLLQELALAEQEHESRRLADEQAAVAMRHHEAARDAAIKRVSRLRTMVINAFLGRRAKPLSRPLARFRLIVRKVIRKNAQLPGRRP
jgi:hypothetical protein